jgi:hypothetical protein
MSACGRSGRLPDLNIPAHLLAEDDYLGAGRDRSVIYTRYSSDAQSEDSTDRQIDTCAAYEKRVGLRNVGRYNDQGVTGTTTERAELQRLLEDAERGRFSDVVFESLDRLARKLKVAVEICEALLDLGITIHDVEEGRALNIYDVGVKGAAAQDEEFDRYPADYLEKARLKATKEYQAVIRSLSEVEALSRSALVMIDPNERIEAHRKLISSLDHLFSDKFDTTSETGTKILAALRQLIHSVTIDFDDTSCTINLKCRMVDPGDDSDANIATFSRRAERYPNTPTFR